MTADHRPTEWITPRDPVRYVIDRGLLGGLSSDADASRLEAAELPGGVSGEVVLVRGPRGAVVVKRALARLDVVQLWTAKPERALTEAAALDVYSAMTPAHTPELLDIDEQQLTFTMTAAPAAWRNWRSVLLTDELDEAGADDACGVAGVLGAVLGTWHRETWHDPRVAAGFGDYEAFEQLRVTPFHRSVAERHPRLRGVLLDCADELLTRRDCLVHGDFSPKNVLVGSGGSGGVWVLDFEVAHVGAAVFDLAFVHAHLVLKALHRPQWAGVFGAVWARLLQAYRTSLRDLAVPEGIARHTAALLLARVDGTSPADYLGRDTADRVRELAVRTFADPDRTLGELWSDVLTTAARGRSVSGGVRP